MLITFYLKLHLPQNFGLSSIIVGNVPKIPTDRLIVARVKNTIAIIMSHSINAIAINDNEPKKPPENTFSLRDLGHVI